MHIAHVINGLRAGGAEKLVVNFARAIQNRDHQLTVITLRQNVAATEEEVARTGARIVRLPHRKLFHPGRFRRLVALCRAEQFDVIHTQLTMANILGGFAGQLTRTPVTTTLQNTYMHSAERPLHHWLENWVFRNVVKRPIAVGWSIADAHAARMGHKPFTIIPNAVTIPPLPDPETRATTRRSLVDTPDDLCLLLAVGRLEQQKAFPDLLDAFSQVYAHHPEARLFIAGIGSLRAELDAKIEALGLVDTVTLLGLRHDIPQLLAACDIYVSSSWWEGLPLAMLEAMASGKPGVVTDVGDVAKVFSPAMGKIVPPRQPAALAAALCQMIEQPEKWQEMGAAARKKVAADYNAAVLADKLLQLYQDIQPTTVKSV